MADKSDERRARPGATLSQLEADAEAVEAKTARLRALRLAHEARTGVAAGKPAGGKARTSKDKKAAKPAGKAATLSEWLSAQRDEGRRN